MTELEHIVDVITAEAIEHSQPPNVFIRADNDVIRRLPDELGPVADDLERMVYKHHIAGTGTGLLAHLRHKLYAETVAKDAVAAFVEVLQRHDLTATAFMCGPRHDACTGASISTIIVTLKIAAPGATEEAAE